MGVGLDFNPTYFNHAKAEDGFTLSSNDEGIRRFWVEHGKRCRKIGEYFGKEMGQVCYTNHWIPDGYKDITVDKLGPGSFWKSLLTRSLRRRSIRNTMWTLWRASCSAWEARLRDRLPRILYQLCGP